MALSIRKIFTDSFYLSASNSLSRFISFFAVIVITRALNLYEYGALMLVMTVTAPVGLISSFGLEAVLVSDLAQLIGERQLNKVKSIIRSYVSTKLFITAAVLVAAWFVKPWLVTRFGELVNDYYYLLILWVYACMVYTISATILNAHEKFGVISVANIIEVSAKLIFVIIFWISGIINLKFALMAYVLSKLTVTIYLLFHTLNTVKYLKQVKVLKEAIFRKILFTHGKWDVLSQTILQQIDSSLRPWIIKFFIGVEGVAIFSVARSIYTAMVGAVPIKQVIFPLIARNLKDKAQNIIISQKASKYSFVLYFVMSVFAFFLISPFIEIFFPKYESSILLFRILLLRLLVTATSYGQPAFFYAYKQQKALFGFSTINIVSLFTLLPLSLVVFGLPGVYLEKIFTLIIVYTGREFYLRKKYQIKTWQFKSLFKYDFYDKMLVNKILEKIKNFRLKRI